MAEIPCFFTVFRSYLHGLFTRPVPLLSNLVFRRRYGSFTSSARLQRSITKPYRVRNEVVSWYVVFLLLL